VTPSISAWPAIDQLPREKSMSTLDLARVIADHLGIGWRAFGSEDVASTRAHLTGPNRQKLALVNGGKHAHGRLIISGELGDLLYLVPRTLPRVHKITVDQHTPPHRVTREILRRLLPDYEKALTAAWDAHQDRPTGHRRRASRAAVVAAVLGASRRRGDTNLQFGAAAGVRGHGSVPSGDRDSVFTVTVPHYRAGEFARLLNTFGRLH
jgi:hypothetical protein